MPEYRKGAHTIYDIQYHFVWATKYRYHVLRGGGTSPGPDTANLHEPGHQDTERACERRPYPYPGIVSADAQPDEGGPVRERGLVAQAARGIPAPEKALLGAALVGPGLLLRQRGHGDPRPDQGVHRET